VPGTQEGAEPQGTGWMRSPQPRGTPLLAPCLPGSLGLAGGADWRGDSCPQQGQPPQHSQSDPGIPMQPAGLGLFCHGWWPLARQPQRRGRQGHKGPLRGPSALGLQHRVPRCHRHHTPPSRARAWGVRGWGQYVPRRSPPPPAAPALPPLPSPPSREGTRLCLWPPRARGEVGPPALSWSPSGAGGPQCLRPRARVPWLCHRNYSPRHRAKNTAGAASSWARGGTRGESSRRPSAHARGWPVPSPQGHGDTAGRRPAEGLPGSVVGTYSVETEVGEEGEGSAQSLEASHPAWLPAAGPWHRRCPFPGADVPRQSCLSVARTPTTPSSGLQRRPPGSAAPQSPPERAVGLRASVGRTRAVALPLLPSSSRSSRPALPFPNATGQGGGVAAGRAGVTPWPELLPGDPRPAAGLGPGWLAAQRSPGGVIFSRGWDARPGGRAPINVPLSPLFGERRQLGAWTPSPISMETRPGLGKRSRASVSPQEAGREGEETSGSPVPNRGHRHDARAMGTAGGASGSANVPAAQLPAPAGALPWGATSPWGLAPLSWRGCHPAPSLPSTRGLPGENSRPCRQPRRERGKTHSNLLPQPPACLAPPNRSHGRAGGQVGGG